MLPETQGPAAQAVAQKVRARLLATYELDRGIVSITVSIGIVIYREEGKGCDALIEQADAAMYLEKVSRASAMDSEYRPAQPAAAPQMGDSALSGGTA